MKNTISTFLLGSFLSLSFHAIAAEAEIVSDENCFVVSGGHYDHNGALTSLVAAERAGTKYSFAGYNCSIFNSYKALKIHLANSVEKESPIFVVQIAHGGLGGTSALNGGTISAGQLLKELREISASYKVAFLNQSCYGGSVIQEKILWDESNSNSESIDRTCLWSDSLPGRVAMGLNSILKSKNPYTLEEAYTALPDGIVSSAAWSEVGMAKYHYAISQLPGYRLKDKLVTKELAPLSGQFLNGMADIISSHNEVAPNAKKIMNSAKFVLSATTKDADIKSYLALAKAGQYNFEAVRVGTFSPPASTDVCTLAVRKFVQAQWYPVFRVYDSVWGLFLNKLQSELPENKEFKESCGDSGIEANVSAMDWARWLNKYSPVGFQMENYARAVDNYARNNPDAAKAGLSLEKFVADAFADLNITPTTKTDILLSIIGRTILNEESSYLQMPDGSRMLTGYPNVGVEGATGNVLPAFNLASFKQVEMKNPLDERRRNACRSIQLKAW